MESRQAFILGFFEQLDFAHVMGMVIHDLCGPATDTRRKFEYLVNRQASNVNLTALENGIVRAAKIATLFLRFGKFQY